MQGLRLAGLNFTLVTMICLPVISSPLRVDISGQQTAIAPFHETFPPPQIPQDTKTQLEHVPSLQVTELGGPGQMTRLNFRGLSSRHTLLKVDGIPVYDALNSVDAASFFGGSLQLDQVIPGSGGIFEGSGSTGGTIEMKTPFAEKNGNRITLMGGSFDTGYVHAMHGVNDDQTSGVVHVEGFNTAGLPKRGRTRMYGERAHAQRGAFAAALNHQTDQQQVQVTLRQLTNRNKYDNNGPTGPFSPKPQGTQTQNLTLLGGKFAHHDLHCHHNLQTFLSQNKLKGSGSPASHLTHYGGAYTLDYHVTPQTSATGIMGADFDHLTQGTFKKAGIAKTHAGFLIRHRLWKHLSLYGGLRLNRHQKFGSTTTHSVGTQWIEKNRGLSANYRSGFLNPSLYDLHVNNPYALANPRLKPEESQTLDVTLRQRIGEKAEIKISPFWTRIRKMIRYVTIAGGQFQNQNMPGTSRISGVETRLSLVPSPRWHHELTYGYTNFDLNAAHINTEYPKHKLGWATRFVVDEKLSFRSDVTFTGRRKSQGHTLAAYTKTNLSADYLLSMRTKLFARIDNLFDARYTETYYFQTPGQSFYVGTQIYC